MMAGQSFHAIRLKTANVTLIVNLGEGRQIGQFLGQIKRCINYTVKSYKKTLQNTKSLRPIVDRPQISINLRTFKFSNNFVSSFE